MSLNIGKKEKNKMLLSKETRTGIEMTGNCGLYLPQNFLICFSIIVMSFIDLVKYLFTYPNIRYFLSEKICQDPLEKFFGCQRQRGRVNENPTVFYFIKNTQALRVCGNLAQEVKGNCRGTKSLKRALDIEDLAPIAKRRRHAQMQRES